MKTLRLFLFLQFTVIFISEGRQFPPSDFTDRVKQLDEFFERFNGVYRFKEGKVARKEGVLRLFDYQLLLKTDSVQKKCIQDFIWQVCDSLVGKKLDYEDSDWYALSEFSALYEGKAKSLQLCLQAEIYPDKSSKWVIVGTESLKKYPKAQNKQFLPPSSHERNFMEMRELSKKPDDFMSLFSQNFAPNPLSDLYRAVSEQRLEILHTEQTVFYFLKIPGFIFKVSEVNRTTHNSGKLITEIFRADAREKEIFRAEKLYLR